MPLFLELKRDADGKRESNADGVEMRSLLFDYGA